MTKLIKTNQPDELNDAVIRAIGESHLTQSSRLTKNLYSRFFNSNARSKMIARQLLEYNSHCHPYVQWNFLADCCGKLKKDDKLCIQLLDLFSSYFNLKITDPASLKNIIATHYVNVFKGLLINSIPEQSQIHNPEKHAKLYFHQYRIEQGSVLPRPRA